MSSPDVSFVQSIQTAVLAVTVGAAVWATIHQLRPYLGVSSRWIGPKDNNEWLEVDADGRYSTKVFVTNYGKTPARDVRVHGVCQVLPEHLREDEIRRALDAAPLNRRNQVPRVCDPNATLPLYYELKHAGAVRLPNPDERVYKFGVITYIDLFNIDHERRFAAYWDGHSVASMGSGWVPASQHNDVD